LRARMPHGASRTSPPASDQGSTTLRPDSPGRQRAPYSNAHAPSTGTSSCSSSDADKPDSHFPLGSRCCPQRSRSCRFPRGSVRSKPPLPYQPSCLFSQIAAAEPFHHHPRGLGRGLCRWSNKSLARFYRKWKVLLCVPTEHHRIHAVYSLRPPPPPPAASSPDQAASAPWALPSAWAAQSSSRTRKPPPASAPLRPSCHDASAAAPGYSGTPARCLPCPKPPAHTATCTSGTPAPPASDCS